MNSTLQPHKRRRRQRFTLLALLIVVVTIAVGLGAWVTRTRLQMHICEQIDEAGGECYLNDPPGWLNFLPSEWLLAWEGHWCCTVKEVEVLFSGEDGSLQENASTFKQQLIMASELSSVQSLKCNIGVMDASAFDFAYMLSPIAYLNSLRELDIHSDRGIDVLQALPRLPELESLSLSISDEDLTTQAAATIAKNFPKLVSLEIDGGDDGDFNPLATLSSLRTIDAYGVTTSDIQSFANHPSLECLAVDSGSFNDDFLRILATCPRLKSINANGSFVTDKGLSYLQNMQSLEKLELSYTEITEVGLAHLANCKSLTSFQCSHSELNDNSLSFLQGLSQLRELDLSVNPITDAGFTNLSNCKSLAMLRCDGCKLTNAIGPVLAKLTKLEELDLLETKTSSDLLEHLSSHQYLRRCTFGDDRIDLNLLLTFLRPETTGGCIRGSWWEAAYQFGNLPRNASAFGQVSLEGVLGISGRLSQLKARQAIQSLNLSNTDINDSDLRDLTSLPNLTTLDLTYTSITLDGLKYLANIPTITKLRIGPFEDPDLVVPIIPSLKGLKELRLIGVQYLSSAGRTKYLELHSVHGIMPEPF